MNLNNIVEQFDIRGKIESISAFGSGHINTTYRVETSNCEFDYVLQSINTDVFKNIDYLSDNISRILSHIKNKLSLVFPSDEIFRRSLTLVKTKYGDSYYKDNDGIYWRVFIFITNSETIDFFKNEEYAYLAGAAFGDYQWMLSDLPSPLLYDTIPNFHNTPSRIAQFKKTIALDSYNRLADVQKEVDFLLSFEEEMSSIIKFGKQGIIPKRNIHQDTKLSNILFDKNGELLCVIDLDTTMPGYLCYDFGDAVRGGMNTGAEDDEDIENVSVDMNLYKSFVKGYAATTKNFILESEIRTLAFGAKLITYEQCVRFLEDYLNGDVYYKCHKPKHNLIRAKAQIALLQSIISNYDDMESIVKLTYI